jgi:excisionase family DNA binding protein
MTDIILQKLELLINLITNQVLIQKEVLNFKEACQYIGASQSHMYKLTSCKAIPHFCPQGKRLYFKRSELDAWLMRNRSNTNDETEKQAADYLIRQGKAKL